MKKLNTKVHSKKKDKSNKHSHFNPNRSVDIVTVSSNLEKKKTSHHKNKIIEHDNQEHVNNNENQQVQLDNDIENNINNDKRRIKDLILDEADELIDAHMDETDVNLRWRRYFWLAIFCGVVGAGMTIFGLSATIFFNWSKKNYLIFYLSLPLYVPIVLVILKKVLIYGNQTALVRSYFAKMYEVRDEMATLQRRVRIKRNLDDLENLPPINPQPPVVPLPPPPPKPIEAPPGPGAMPGPGPLLEIAKQELLKEVERQKLEDEKNRLEEMNSLKNNLFADSTVFDRRAKLLTNSQRKTKHYAKSTALVPIMNNQLDTLNMKIEDKVMVKNSSQLTSALKKPVSTKRRINANLSFSFDVR